MAEFNFIKHIILLILRFLYDSNLKETCRMLGKETRIFFDSEYFSELIRNGEWEKADNYLGSFTSLENNEFSMKLFFEIRKQKYLEASDRGDRCRTKNILLTDLLFLYYTSHDLFEGCVSLLRLPHFSKHFQLASWKNVEFARELIASFLVKVLNKNPDTKDILELPEPKGRLEILMRQSWNLQYTNCLHFMSDNLRGLTTLLEDHQCPTGSGSKPLSWSYPHHQMPEDQPPPSSVSTDLELGMAGPSLSKASLARNNPLLELLAATLPNIPEGNIDLGDFPPLITNNAPPADHSRFEVGSSSGASRMLFGFNVDAGPSSSHYSRKPGLEEIMVEEENVDLAPATGPEIIFEEEDYASLAPPTRAEATQSVPPPPERLFSFDVPQMHATAADPSSDSRARTSEAERRPAGSARRKGKAPARVATGKPGPKPGKSSK